MAAIKKETKKVIPKKKVPVKSKTIKPAKKTVSKKASIPNPVTSKSRIKEEKRWMTENDVRTLLQAEEIKLDKARLDAARVLAQEQVKAAQKIVSNKLKE